MSSPAPAAVMRPYPRGFEHLMRGRVDVLVADLRIALLGGGYTPADGHGWYTDLTDEVVAAGYTAGGQPLTARTCEWDPVLGKQVLECDPVRWEQTGFGYRYAVCYARTTDPAGSPLLAYLDMGQTVQTSGDPLPLAFDAGVYRLGAAP